MARRKKKDKDPYKAEGEQERSFIAYIIKGNRQVVSREVVASKRFRVEDETYIIKPECIFLKNVDGKFKSVSYYRQGNPNPYNFKGDNIGMLDAELDRFFAEDFFSIIVNIRPENRSIYIFILAILVLMFNLMFMVSLILVSYLL